MWKQACFWRSGPTRVRCSNAMLGRVLLWVSCSVWVDAEEHGQDCLLQGLRGVGLSVTDAVALRANCAQLRDSYLAGSPPPRGAILAGPSGYEMNLGAIPLTGHAEQVQVCWCRPSDLNDCSDFSWQYTTVAMSVNLACAAGWYDLPWYDELRQFQSTLCKPCLPGSYCLGGWPAHAATCPAGSTSAGSSQASTACACREGFSWDGSACRACAEGTFKDTVGNSNCAGTCPTGTTSVLGAISLRECYCVGDAIDIDPAADAFNCSDLNQLNKLSEDMNASRSASVFTSSGRLNVTNAGSDALVSEIRSAFLSFLEVSSMSRVSAELSAGYSDGVGWYVNYTVSTSEEALGWRLAGRLDPDVIGSWVIGLRGTALEGAKAFESGDLVAMNILCPDGLAFPDGHRISGLVDCQCPHGMEPATAGSTGLASGCTKCPLGTYKSSIADTACAQCPAGETALTTLEAGAVSHAACTCSAGQYSPDPLNPASCQNCGLGFYCQGGAHRETCPSSQTTLISTATSVDSCLCAAGFLKAATCEACAAGKFKPTVSNDACTACAPGKISSAGQATCNDCEAGRYTTGGQSICDLCPEGRYSTQVAAGSLDLCLPCAAGKWSNATAVSSASGCRDCVTGSTTASIGAQDESFCVQPNGNHSKTCISGRICVVTGVAGSRLQNGHRLGITSSVCGSATAVSGIVLGGISKAATGSGSSYQWGSAISDFVPQGGLVHLCWCAQMRDLTCESLTSNFFLSAGQLLIVGPLTQDFTCVRGRDCRDLKPFKGYGLSTGDSLYLQRDACGSSLTNQISPANQLGSGTFAPLSTSGDLVELILGFGQSDAASDFKVQIDANQAGYLLCWCQPTSGSCDPASHVVAAGRLSVHGPNTNQERGCAVGQSCSIQGVTGASVLPGDRLQVLSDCGTGAAIPGFPGQGVLNTSDGANFIFINAADYILLSVPGIFRLCFCRPSSTESCGSSAGFIARVGLMTASGPFVRASVCILSSNCTIELSGVGLLAGDQLWVAQGQCGAAQEIVSKGFTNLAAPLPVEDGANGLVVNLGVLPFEALPDVYQLCWCPSSADCTSNSSFRAPAGSLQTDCPPGSFATGPPSGRASSSWALEISSCARKPT